MTVDPIQRWRLDSELWIIFSFHFCILCRFSITYFHSVKPPKEQAWSRLKNILKSKSKFIESKFSELKSKSVFIESVFYVFVFDFGTTSVYRKITIRYISIQNSTGVISINIELYRFYSVISKWHRFQLLLKNCEYFPSVISVSDRFFMVLVVYKGSHISVSDRFLFKKRFYFDICIGFIPVFFQWELYIFGMGLIYLWYGNYI
jgi:hypothetical protein